MKTFAVLSVCALCLFSLSGCWLFDVWGTDPDGDPDDAVEQGGGPVADNPAASELTLDGICEVTAAARILGNIFSVELRCQDAEFSISSELDLAAEATVQTQFVFTEVDGVGVAWELTSVEILEAVEETAPAGNTRDPIVMTLDGVCEVTAVIPFDNSENNSVKLACDEAVFSVVSNRDLEVNDSIDAQFTFYQVDDDGAAWELEAVEI